LGVADFFSFFFLRQLATNNNLDQSFEGLQILIHW